MDQSLKDLPQHGRPRYAGDVQHDAGDDGENGQLVPVDEDVFPVGFKEGRDICRLPAVVVIIAHGEEDEEHDQPLEYADDLRVGKGDFAVQQVAAQAAQGRRVGGHRRNEVAALIYLVGKPPLPVEQEDDSQGEEGVEKREEGQRQQVRLQRQDPHAEQGQDGHDADDVEADEKIALGRRHETPLL